MHQSHLAGCGTSSHQFPLFDGPAGTFRIWGNVCAEGWQGINPARGSFDFSGLDLLLADLKNRGINDVFITLGKTPSWISSNPTDMLCDEAGMNNLPPGMCDPPVDLNPDGTGTDQAWRDFVTTLVQHVSASDYLANHAHIAFYEIWNEFHRSDTVATAVCQTPSAGISCSYRGTFAQMLRMAQDLRCIVEGHSSDPITATGLTCGTSGYTATGLDPTAMIMAGDAGPQPLDDGNTVMENYLDCGANPPAGSMCNYGNAGAAATDVVVGHVYFTHGEVPEDLLPYIAVEKAMADTAGKPYFIGEGSWGKNEDTPNPTLQAAYVPRWYLTLLISGVQRAYWYAWDHASPTGSGALWSPDLLSGSPLECDIPDLKIGGYYCTGGIAYYETVDWLSDATIASVSCPGSCTNPGPGVFTVGITRSGGYEAEIVWDSSAVSSCSNPQCGSTPFPNPPFTVSQWRDVTATTHNGAPATIGASPIILENMPRP
ncbi:MAG: beta-galactosidase [Acidobacteriia bacterium]|nr:beta-galactosidase [Terriglobia bacterium]